MPRDLIRLPDRTRRWSGQRAEYPEARLAILWLGDAGCDDDQLVGGEPEPVDFGLPRAGWVLNHPRPRAGPE